MTSEISSGRNATIAIISGASSGIGRQFAINLDADTRLDEIWLCARREERLNELAESLTKPTRVLAGDITDKNWRDQLLFKIKDSGSQIHTLINSAGFGKFDAFCDLDCNEDMVEVNCLALTALTSICLPYMKRGGRIINLASVAGFMPQYKAAVYAASKAYVISFSRALHQELKERDITVTAVCPNPMKTEFFEVNGIEFDANPIKKMGFEDVEKVAAKALKRSDKGKDMSVCNLPAKSLRLLSRILPHRLVLWFERKSGF
ncbi:MAG: SDR family NAD(P)-dependent oxidoreductase [Clostridiaceae bacterium]|nr:SDR family NAD(P)-dependent oxidoreductase [Clostridiaceae bacterium]